QRLIVQRCLYGVDKNHLAVEMAKLSLWLLVLARDEPFTFLDHAIKCGDSLVGLSAEQVKALDWQPLASPLFAELDDATREAATRRGEIVGLGVGHEAEKALLHRSAETALADAKLVGDVVVAAFFKGTKDKERRAFREEARTLVERWKSGKVERSALEAAAAELQRGEHPLSPFHWELEFPEVFGRENPGFDAVVGNPPFLGGRNLTASQGFSYSHWLVEVQVGSSAAADLVARFFRQSFSLLRNRGTWGLIATNTIAQGDTRNTGLRWICNNGGVLVDVTKRVKWPGAAAVVVSLVHGFRGQWEGARMLDGHSVSEITAFLFHAGGHDDPNQLECNAGKSFQGSILLGMGFTFDDTDKKGVANSIADMERLVAEDA
ncbi:MAG: DNA methyltransferase, partial [Planctomycetota bacterium]|nr:DNA methyltransferase [Planctomycetota bacterium]